MVKPYTASVLNFMSHPSFKWDIISFWISHPWWWSAPAEQWEQIIMGGWEC
jgi:hypothetical protein